MKFKKKKEEKIVDIGDLYLTLGVLVRGNAKDLQNLLDFVKKDSHLKIVFTTSATCDKRLFIVPEDLVKGHIPRGEL
jgi:hypothetical protein